MQKDTCSIKVDVPFIVDKNIDMDTDVFTADQARNNFKKEKINYKYVNKELKRIINRIKLHSTMSDNLTHCFFLKWGFVRPNMSEQEYIKDILESWFYDVRFIENGDLYISWGKGNQK